MLSYDFAPHHYLNTKVALIAAHLNGETILLLTMRVRYRALPPPDPRQHLSEDTPVLNKS